MSILFANPLACIWLSRVGATIYLNERTYVMFCPVLPSCRKANKLRPTAPDETQPPVDESSSRWDGKNNRQERRRRKRKKANNFKLRPLVYQAATISFSPFLELEPESASSSARQPGINISGGRPPYRCGLISFFPAARIRPPPPLSTPLGVFQRTTTMMIASAKRSRGAGGPRSSPILASAAGRPATCLWRFEIFPF